MFRPTRIHRSGGSETSASFTPNKDRQCALQQIYGLAEFWQYDIGKSCVLEISPLRQSHLIAAAFALPLAWSVQAAPPESSEALDLALPDRVGGPFSNYKP